MYMYRTLDPHPPTATPILGQSPKKNGFFYTFPIKRHVFKGRLNKVKKTNDLVARDVPYPVEPIFKSRLKVFQRVVNSKVYYS